MKKIVSILLILILVVALSGCFMRPPEKPFKTTEWRQIQVVVASKFIWDPDDTLNAEEPETYSNGETKITISGDAPEYNIKITDGGSIDYLDVTADEYEQVEKGTFITVWEKTDTITETGEVHICWYAIKTDDVFDSFSHGQLIINGPGVKE